MNPGRRGTSYSIQKFQEEFQERGYDGEHLERVVESLGATESVRVYERDDGTYVRPGDGGLHDGTFERKLTREDQEVLEE